MFNLYTINQVVRQGNNDEKYMHSLYFDRLLFSFLFWVKNNISNASKTKALIIDQLE